MCWPTSLGWMMGPWLLYASLLNGACAALFQGSPLGRPFGEFVQAAGVACLGLVPSIAKVGCVAALQCGARRVARPASALPAACAGCRALL